MTKRIVPALLLAASTSLVLAGCVYMPNQPRVTEDREIEDVTALVLKTDGDVVVTLGDTPSLTITAPESLMERLSSEVDGDVLTLDLKGPHLGYDRVDYAITVTSLDDIAIEGSGDIDVDFTGAEEIRLAIDGSGDIDGVGVDATRVEGSIEGSGDIELTGRADELSLEIDGSGNFEGQELETERSTVSISGSGDVEVFATETLDAEISGSGEIRYTGGAEVSSDVSGSGSIVEDD
jgi:hypothetical protein